MFGFSRESEIWNWLFLLGVSVVYRVAGLSYPVGSNIFVVRFLALLHRVCFILSLINFARARNISLE